MWAFLDLDMLMLTLQILRSSLQYDEGCSLISVFQPVYNLDDQTVARRELPSRSSAWDSGRQCPPSPKPLGLSKQVSSIGCGSGTSQPSV